MFDTSRPFSKNKILSQLEGQDLQDIRDALEPFEMPSGKVLFHPDEPIDYLYFPNEAVISVMASTEDGQSAAVGMIGYEGVVGVDALMGAASVPHTVSALYGDGAHRIKVKDIIDPFNKCGPLHEQLLRFTQRLMVQMSQKTICNRLHTLDQRLGRWLLMCDDRTPSQTLLITQELLATMLGSTRASVTLAAIEMQNNGLITYSRGKIVIVDRKGIEQVTCECYGVIRQAYDEE